ncbi:MAG: hypothetical protein M1814_005901 [Vezdaea aestivalis]|nr:MAG: hypothetical protein M1814_005901 [Vezdaea aestivalis]
MGALAQRLPLALASSVAVVALPVVVQQSLSAFLSTPSAQLTSPQPLTRRLPFLRVLVLIFALLNFKALPFVWHVRVFKAIFQHIPPFRRSPPPSPSLLFCPKHHTTRNIPLDCDYNLHKSNSTYFTDLDISRADLVADICQQGIGALRKEARAEGQRFTIPLGGVACEFYREIKPGAKYEVWSRLLSWDRKWIYIISWFVLPGAGEKKILTAGVSRYVFKIGRKTISPERVLRLSGVLPEGEPPKGGEAEAEVGQPLVLAAEEVISKEGEWGWNRIEAERVRGLKTAQLMGEMGQGAGEDALRCLDLASGDIEGGKLAPVVGVKQDEDTIGTSANGIVLGEGKVALE